MRRFRHIVMLIGCACLPFALLAEEKAVMLFLSASDQDDTLGYNLVRELPAVLYPEIMSGSLALWDSPDKQVRILPASLAAIEKNKGVSFASSPQLFIYEQWTLGKKSASFAVSGFYFSDRSAAGEPVSYGYVDYNDAEMLLTSSPIHANANGSCFSTFKYILRNHLYFYNIVQFGTRTIGSLEESQALKTRYAGAETGITAGTQSKKVVYSVQKPDAADVSVSAGAASYAVLKLVEDFLAANPEVYLNLGGHRFSDFSRISAIAVESLEAEEIWTKTDSGIHSQLVSVTIRLRPGPLDAVSAEDLWKLDVREGETRLTDLLVKKEFYFRVLMINSDTIRKEESDKYVKALKTFYWNKIREYVRYD